LDNLKSKSIKAFFWDFIGKIANQGIAFLTSIILARILAPEEFGLIALINVIFSFANIFMDVGLAASLIQRKRLLPIHFSSVFYFNISVGLLLTIITFFSAPLVAAFYNIPILEILTQVMSISFIISSFGIVQNIQLKKVLNFKKITSLQLLAVIISGIVGVAMAYTGYGVWSLLTQILLNRFLYTALVWIVVKWTPGFNFSLKALKQLWGFGFRIFISDIFGVLYNQMDVIIVGKLFPINSLGYLQRAKSLNTTIFQLASSSLTQVLFPVLSSVQNEIEKFKSIVTRSLYVISFATLFISGILYLCADDLIIILFTKKWLSSI
jgi:O-antigen/teichoic acid export membrane protein